MTILVECECGEKFEVSTNLERHKSNNESASVFVGSRKCPNPICNRTIYIDAIISTEIDDDSPIITAQTEDVGRSDLIDWDIVKDGDSLYHGGLPFEVAHKFIRGEDSKRILALRSLCHGENVIAEVDNIGHISFVPWKPPEDNTSFNVNNPCTNDGFETWTEEGHELMMRLKSTKDVDASISSEKIDCTDNYLDWDLISEGQEINIDNKHCRVIFKTLRESISLPLYIRVLYLESVLDGAHLIAEVKRDGTASFLMYCEPPSFAFMMGNPHTPNGYETWTNEMMKDEKRCRKVNRR